MKLKAKLDAIRRMYPKGPTRDGQLYSGKLPVGRWKRVTLYTLFVSDEDTHLLRPHVFASERQRTAAQWSAWFGSHLSEIHIKAVLPGIGIRTNKSWAVKQILGWAALNAKHKPNTARMGRKRHKAKSQGKSVGQTHLRRRHRNGRRKAK